MYMVAPSRLDPVVPVHELLWGQQAIEEISRGRAVIEMRMSGAIRR